MKKLTYLFSMLLSTSVMAKHYSTDPNHTFPFTPGSQTTRALQQEAVQSLAYTAPFAFPYLWNGCGNGARFPGTAPWLCQGRLPAAFPPLYGANVGSNFNFQPIAREEVDQGDLVIFASNSPNHPPQMAIFTGNDRVVTFRISKSSGHHHNLRYSQLLNEDRIISVFRLLY